MFDVVKQQRYPRHVKKVLDQWYSCAKKSQNETIRVFNKNLLKIIAEAGKQLWISLVRNINVDGTLETNPKVEKHMVESLQQAGAQQAVKRRADEEHGPAVNTPISALRKKKNRRQNVNSDIMSDGEVSVMSDDSKHDEADREITAQVENVQNERIAKPAGKLPRS